MGILYVHVSSDASESEHEQAREALALALSIDPTSQPSERVNVSERVSQASKPSQGNHGAPAKGSQEARDRMAAVRAAKAAKASGQASKASASTSKRTGKASGKASDRIAALAAKAGLVAVPDPEPTTAKATTAKRFTLPAFASDLTDGQADALEAFCENLVDQRKLTAMVLYLQGKASRDDLSEVSSRGGTLVDHAERVVRRAERD